MLQAPNRRANEIGGVEIFTDDFTHGLTLCFGTDEAGCWVAKRAQDGADGQAEVLVARVESDRGEAKVGQLRGFFRTNFHMRDLGETGRMKRKE